MIPIEKEILIYRMAAVTSFFDEVEKLGFGVACAAGEADGRGGKRSVVGHSEGCWDSSFVERAGTSSSDPTLKSR